MLILLGEHFFFCRLSLRDMTPLPETATIS
jgi:hypothetical protein